MLILETERLSFRHLVRDDLDELFELYSNPEMRRYFPEGTLTYDATREELEWFMNGHPEHPELGRWATIHRPTGRFIGRCGLLPWTIEGRDEVEIAYMIAKPFWRQGLGAEAARGILEYARAELGLSRLVCLIDPGNEASIGVARSIGMAVEAEIPDEEGAFLLYSTGP